MKNKLLSFMLLPILFSSISCKAQTVRSDERKSNNSETNISAVSEMKISRAAHTATLLNDSRVLIVGGFSGEQVSLASVEIFDPRTDEFSSIGNMKFARAGHTATLLPDGKVLIAGGYNGNYLDSAEIFDPKTNDFTLIGKLTMPRSEHIAVLLNNGKVLLAGGVGTGWTFLDSAEIFDPQTDNFSATRKMTTARESHTATLLKDGRVLITGGHQGRRAAMTVYSSTEIFDPSKNEFTKGANLTVKRHKHDAVLLNDGKVLVVGGSDERDSRGAYTTAEIFNPSEKRFTKTADMNLSRYKLNGTTILLKNGKILIAGGANQAEIFNPSKNTFALTSGNFDSSRLFSTATLLQNGKVLIVGGYNQKNDVSKQAWIYNAN
ncbi:kelch repeat-containing protein [soil metagenome]